MNLSNNILFPLPDLDLILVQGGVFQMGLLEEDPDSFGDEQPHGQCSFFLYG